jgi:hypothetical protein
MTIKHQPVHCISAREILMDKDKDKANDRNGATDKHLVVFDPSCRLTLL